MVITSRIGGDRFVGVWVSNRRDPGADPVRRCDARGSGYAADDIHGRCIQCAGATHGERCRTAGVVEQATLGQIDGGRSLYGDGAARAAIKAEHAAQTRRIGNRNRTRRNDERRRGERRRENPSLGLAYDHLHRTGSRHVGSGFWRLIDGDGDAVRTCNKAIHSGCGVCLGPYSSGVALYVIGDRSTDGSRICSALHVLMCVILETRFGPKAYESEQHRHGQSGDHGIIPGLLANEAVKEACHPQESVAARELEFSEIPTRGCNKLCSERSHGAVSG